MEYKNGFTLIELIVSLFIILAILSSVSRIVLYSTNFHKKKNVEIELLENARISMDFIENQIKNCYEIKIVNKKNDSLKYIEFYNKFKGNSNEIEIKENTIIEFFKEEYFDRKNNTIRFGGRDKNNTSKYTTQELAKYIENVEAELDSQKNMLSITITTKIKLEDNYELKEAIVLNREFYLKHKKIHI